MNASIEVQADLLSLRALGPWSHDLLAAGGTERQQELAPKVELAMQEVCVNIVEHAYGGPSDEIIHVSCEIDGSKFRFVVRDSGAPYDIADKPAIDKEKPTVGGYGLFLAESLSEFMSYERREDENRWTLEF